MYNEVKDPEGDATESSKSNIPAVTGESPAVPDACCKVKRVTTAYNIDGIDEELRRRREQGGETLHELANFVNDRVTISALNASGVDIKADPSTVRAAIEGDDSVSMVDRDSIREAVVGSLDIEQLRGDYVSHETVRRHLNEHLDISTRRGKDKSREEFEQDLKKLRQQYEDAIMGALKRANEDGFIDGQNFRVFSTRIECRQCSTTYRLQELIENGGCNCHT